MGIKQAVGLLGGAAGGGGQPPNPPGGGQGFPAFIPHDPLAQLKQHVNQSQRLSQTMMMADMVRQHHKDAGLKVAFFAGYNAACAAFGLGA